MGDSMTDLNTTGVASTVLPIAAPAAFLPPVAPLKMPVQVLEAESSLLQLLFAPFIAGIAVLLHGFRRTN
jgi:hypothetical protein